MSGKFLISLDFELMWGLRDEQTIADYGDNIKAVHEVIPRLLEILQRHGCHATFAIVGFLFFETKREMLSCLPSRLPQYIKRNLSPYEGYFDTVGESTATDPYHYAPHLIRLIQQCQQEIGTHTFSHYYCLEQGQSIEEFRADLINAQRVAKKYGIKLISLVFPRNQCNTQYLDVCHELGIICFRGNAHSWLYAARNWKMDNLLRRALRLADAYINISGHNCYNDIYLQTQKPLNIPASRFMRPYSAKLKWLEFLRLQRIKSDMKYAAVNRLTYHLWWHPHNFGSHQNENFAFLEHVLCYFDQLRKEYDFQSYSMSELAQTIINS